MRDRHAIGVWKANAEAWDSHEPVIIPEGKYLVGAQSFNLRRVALGPGLALVLAEPKEGLVTAPALRPTPGVGLIGVDAGVAVHHELPIRQPSDTRAVPDGPVRCKGAPDIQGAWVGPCVASVVALDEHHPRCTGYVEI